MLFQKENMLGSHYAWTEQEAAYLNGTPSRRLFDRFNGYQVLFIINYYASQERGFTVEVGQQIENKVLNELPMDAKSEKSVFQWLRESNVTI
ncbi:MAG TPA: hypothetical protein VK644_03590 [Chitinophagaceae bacterium]|nr:hypothetical protein [Chitinophagaceae bacterium]